MAIDIKEIEVGTYEYNMPHWTSPKKVEVIEIDGELKVVFVTGYYPTSVKDLPYNATLTRI